MSPVSGRGLRERRFALPGLTLAASEWGDSGGVPLLALHGWLDNASSFDLLAPLLTGSHLVALDLAGHGQSGFRSPDSSYNLWQDVGDLLDVADALGWQKLNLLGHSRGGAIAMLFAATFPERVAKLVLIDGGLPIPGDAEQAPVELAKALRERRAVRPGRVFSDRATAVAERARGFSKISVAAAEVLARRGLVAVDGGFQWRADPRLKATSELRLTPAHTLAFVRRVAARVLLFQPDESPFKDWAIYREALPAFANLEIVHLAGSHHLHLEGAAESIAAEMRRFLALP
jgi:pimeloyl-ACP methyl ester carboxylesterase